ncbi:MAG: CopG family transcriptional regulator [Nitrospinae bacterium]|nr:CopG family transcriptional regulator [Nitrospinota bacterium]
MKKKVPKLKSDEEAEEFLDQDLTDYLDLKNFQRVSFEFQPKTKKINIRVSEELLEAVKKKAKRQKISYQKYIRKVVEESLLPK